jgi:hypothetical protein
MLVVESRNVQLVGSNSLLMPCLVFGVLHFQSHESMPIEGLLFAFVSLHNMHFDILKRPLAHVHPFRPPRPLARKPPFLVAVLSEEATSLVSREAVHTYVSLAGPYRDTPFLSTRQEPWVDPKLTIQRESLRDQLPQLSKSSAVYPPTTGSWPQPSPPDDNTASTLRSSPTVVLQSPPSKLA